MRFLLPLFVAFLVVDAAPAQGKKKDEKKDGSSITEIGGRTLDEWIKDINHKDPGRRATALSTILMFGPDRAYEALPAILEQMGRSVTLDVSVRVNGATALGLILGSAREADPKHVREAVKILQRLCSDTQAIVKFRAVQALGRIGDEAKAAIPNVLPVLKDTLACEARQAAAITLGQIAIDKDKGPSLLVLKELFAALGDHAAQVRLAAIQSLTWLGAPADPKAQQSLLAALDPVANKDIEPTVRLWAHMAMMSITRRIDAEHIAPIVKMMDHPEVPVRIQVAQALGTIGPKAKSGIPALVAHLTDKDPGVIMVCIWALGRMEDNATLAVPHLEKIVSAPDMPDAIKDTAKEAIKQISGKKK